MHGQWKLHWPKSSLEKSSGKVGERGGSIEENHNDGAQEKR